MSAALAWLSGGYRRWLLPAMVFVLGLSGPSCGSRKSRY